jgi:hypothetical protein
LNAELSLGFAAGWAVILPYLLSVCWTRLSINYRTKARDKRILKVVQAPGFIRGINPKSKIENPQAPAFIRGVNLKSKI